MFRYFDDDEISCFCNGIGDFNLLHDAIFMAKRGKKAIVPGKLSFLAAMPSFNFGSKYDVDFKKMVPSGSKIDYEYIDEKFYGLLNGIDAFEISQERDFSLMEPLKKAISFDVSKTYNDFESFYDIVGTNNSLAFPLALSSSALVDLIENPSDDLGEKLKDKVVNFKALPVYKKISFVPFSEPFGNDFNYFSSLKSVGKRGLEYCVDCMERGNLIFKGKYNLEVVPSRVILALCEDLPKNVGLVGFDYS